jgi:hypothetical protein
MQCRDGCCIFMTAIGTAWTPCALRERVCEEQANATKSEVREEEERGREGQGRVARRDIQRRKLTPIQKLTPMYSGWVSFSTSECMLDYYSLFCWRTCNMDEVIDHTHGCNLILNLNRVNFRSPTRIHGWNWSNIDKFGNEWSSKMASNHIIG